MNFVFTRKDIQFKIKRGPATMYFTFAYNARIHSHASFSEEAQIKNAYYEMHFM